MAQSVITVNGTEVHMDYFGSLGEMLDYAAANPSPKDSDTGSASFTDSANLAEAVRLGREGYTEVRPEVDRMVESLRDRIMDRMQVAPMMVYSVAGGVPDVGRFVSGEPECMMDFPPVPQERMGKVVRIVVDYGASASFSASFIRKRGIVLVALIETLKVLGVSVELYGETAIACGSRGGFHTTVTYLHNPADRLDIDSLMFAIAHPSMLRRVAFSVREQSPVYPHIRGTYGQTRKTMYAQTIGADIRMERLESHANTMLSDPIEWVCQTIEGLGLAN